MRYLLGDHLSTTRGLTDSGGLASLFAYEPYGEPTAGDSSLTDYRFTGQFRDGRTGLQHHRARWLDPRAGRWLSEDPVWDFPGNFGNGWGYVGGNVVGAVDASGEESYLSTLMSTAINAVLNLINVGTRVAHAGMVFARAKLIYFHYQITMLYYRLIMLGTMVSTIVARFWNSTSGQYWHRLSHGASRNIERVWQISDVARKGEIIERLRAIFVHPPMVNIGSRLPKIFKTFDFWDPVHKTATSIKSLDPRLYSSMQGMERTLFRYVDSAIDFTRYQLSGVLLRQSDMKYRVVELWVPLNGTSSQAMQSIARAMDYAHMNGIILRVYFL